MAGAQLCDCLSVFRSEKSGSTTIGVFLFTIVGHYLVLIQRYSFNDTLGIVLNIAVAHIVYIVLLWTVLKMRVESATIQERTKTLEYYAHVDPLTQVLNRRGLETAFEALNIDRQQYHQHYAILIIDIDHFKQINDLHGHLIGDKVLTEFAWHLTQLIDDDDVLGRWGGEEFVILTKRKIQSQIFSDAEHIRRVIDSLHIINEVHITVSIGIGYSTEASTSLAVFHVADNNLYAAKHIGRNRVIDSDKAASLIPVSTA
ncbi:GGDEF domain-containing protein [Vibrio sp. PP-XX7]